jgi:hypothetical protein
MLNFRLKGQAPQPYSIKNYFNRVNSQSHGDQQHWVSKANLVTRTGAFRVYWPCIPPTPNALSTALVGGKASVWRAHSLSHACVFQPSNPPPPPSQPGPPTSPRGSEHGSTTTTQYTPRPGERYSVYHRRCHPEPCEGSMSKQKHHESDVGTTRKQRDSPTDMARGGCVAGHRFAGLVRPVVAATGSFARLRMTLGAG